MLKVYELVDDVLPAQVHHVRTAIQLIADEGLFADARALDSNNSYFRLAAMELLETLLDMPIDQVSWPKRLKLALTLVFDDLEGDCSSILQNELLFKHTIDLIESIHFVNDEERDECCWWLQDVLGAISRLSYRTWEQQYKERNASERDRRLALRLQQTSIKRDPDLIRPALPAPARQRPPLETSTTSSVSVSSIDAASVPAAPPSPVASSSRLGLDFEDVLKAVSPASSRQASPVPSTVSVTVWSVAHSETGTRAESTTTQSNEGKRKLARSKKQKSSKKRRGDENECLIPVPEPALRKNERYRETIYKAATVLYYGPASAEFLLQQMELHDKLYGRPTPLHSSHRERDVSRNTRSGLEQYLERHRAFEWTRDQNGTKLYSLRDKWDTHAIRGFSSARGDERKLWCICQRPDGDDDNGMIKCCRPECKIVWWHVREECGNAINYQGPDEKWVCPQCSLAAAG